MRDIFYNIKLNIRNKQQYLNLILDNLTFLFNISFMKTYMMKKEEINRKWYMVDANNQILGRLASKIARILIGKHKLSYTPHVDNGDFVVVVNADKIKVTGNKMEKKKYYRHSGYMGGLKEITLKEVFKKHPERVIKLAVKRMLPKNKKLKHRIKRLKVYTGNEHPHKAQKPQDLSLIKNKIRNNQ